MLLCLTEAQVVNAVFVGLGSDLHLSALFPLWNKAEAQDWRSRSELAALPCNIIDGDTLDDSYQCSLVLFCRPCVCLSTCFFVFFHGDIFQSQIPGILTPD